MERKVRVLNRGFSANWPSSFYSHPFFFREPPHGSWVHELLWGFPLRSFVSLLDLTCLVGKFADGLTPLMVTFLSPSAIYCILVFVMQLVMTNIKGSNNYFIRYILTQVVVVMHVLPQSHVCIICLSLLLSYWDA